MFPRISLTLFFLSPPTLSSPFSTALFPHLLGSDLGLTAEQEAEFAAMADRIGKSVAASKSSKAAAAGAMMSDSEAATSAPHRGGGPISSRKSSTVKPTPESAGVVLVSRIPYGFFEEQMRGFFSQFGTVTRLRLARNRKTGNSKHYAFVEFEAKEVAAIVAETMNNYMMFGRTIQCRFLLPSQVHPETFKNANRTFKVIPHARIHRDRVNAPKSEAQVEAIRARQLEKEAAKRAKLAELGFEYDFPGYEGRATAETAAPKKGKKTAAPAAAAAAPASPAKAAKAAPASPAKSKKAAPAPAPVSDDDDDDDEDEPAPAPKRRAPASPAAAPKKAAAAAAASPAKSKKAAAPAAAEGTPRRSTRQK